MYTYVSIILLLARAPLSLQEQWTFPQNSVQSFFDDSIIMNGFFQEQQKKVKDLISTSYEYVDSMKERGRKLADTISFVPDNDEIDDSEKLINPDIVLSVPGIILRNGYSCETHTVTSKGYIISIHRIPRSKDGRTTPLKTVLLHHGLFASSADWILNGPGKALAYVLADAGYDVWMPNVRGNRYSREHTFLKTDKKAYWNFSWHDVALHDVPAVIDYIKKVKGNETKIAYIGHSMGTTILFAMLSIRPEYNDQLIAGFALAPVVYMSDIKSPVKSIATIASNVAQLEMLYGSHELIPKNSALGRLTSSCDVDNIDSKVCKNVVFTLCGANDEQFNKTLLPVFLTHLGTGTSWKTAIHFCQEISSGGRFQKFDYGSYYNNKVYGSETTPLYDLSKITLPIKLFWAQNDLLSSEKDVRNLYDKLPSGTEMYMVPDPKFSHIDYLWAKDAPTLLNNKVLEMLQRAFNKDQDYYVFNLRFGI